MKKVTVIFPDGSTADIDESQVSAAIAAGAKRYSGQVSTDKSTSMVFPDGSIADVPQDQVSKAASAGAKKKDGTVSGTGTSPSEPTSSKPLDFTKPFQNLLPEPLFVQSLDGYKIPLDNSTLPVSPDGQQGTVNDLQQKINSKTYTDQDINTIAQSSGKSFDAVKSYLDNGSQYGRVVDANDDLQKQQNDLIQNIKDLNQSSGTNYNPDEVLSSADKSAQFLQQINFNPYANTKNKQNPNVAVVDQTAVNIPQPKNLWNNIVPALKNVIINQTVSEDEANGVPKEETIKKIYQRIDPVGYNRANEAIVSSAVSAITNPVGSAVGALFRDDQENNDLIASQKGEAEMLYNNGLTSIGVQTKAQGIETNDQSLIDKGNVILGKVDNNVIDKYPILIKQQMANAVNEKIAQETGVLQGGTTESGHRMERAFGASIDDRARVMEELGYFDDPTKKDLAMQLLAQPSYFADNSLLGGIPSSFAQPFKDLGASLGDITGVRNATDILASRLKDQLFQKDFTNDPTHHLDEAVSVTRTIANTTANLAGMLTIAGLTEGLAGSAGVGLSATERASLMGGELDAAQAAPLLSKVSNISKSLGAWTSFGLPSFDASLKDAKGFIDNEPAQYLYAAINAAANAEGGRLLDLGKFVRNPVLNDVFSKIADGVTKGDIAEDGVKELLTDPTTKNKFIDWATAYGTNVTKGAATMAYFNIVNNTMRLAFGDPTIKSQDILPQATTAFMDGLLGMSIMGAFGASADMKNEKNTSYKGVLYSMALNHDSSQSIFELGLKNGQYTPEQFNEKMQILNTAKAAKLALDKTENITGINLDQSQKAVYVANRTAEAVLREKANNPETSEADKNKYIAQADRLKEQSVQVLDGLKFTPLLEPLYDLHIAEKDKNDALDQLNQNNTPENLNNFLDKSKKVSDLRDQFSSQLKTYNNGKRQEEGRRLQVVTSQTDQGATQNAPSFKPASEEPATKDEIAAFAPEDRKAFALAMVSGDTEKANSIVDKNRAAKAPAPQTNANEQTQNNTPGTKVEIPSMQDSLNAARNQNEPLTKNEQATFDSIPLQDKLAAVRKIVENANLSDQAATEYADKNARSLLEKLQSTNQPEPTVDQNAVKQQSDNLDQQYAQDIHDAAQPKIENPGFIQKSQLKPLNLSMKKGKEIMDRHDTIKEEYKKLIELSKCK